MENASQALLIAGGMLIAILVISLGIFIIRSASNVSERFDTNMSYAEIDKFNSKFSGFDKQSYYVSRSATANDNSNNLRKYTASEMNHLSDDQKKEYKLSEYNNVSDVVSAINLAYSINKKNKYDLNNSIQVSVNLTPISKGQLNGNLGISPLVQKKIWEDAVSSNPKNPDPVDRHCFYRITYTNDKSRNTNLSGSCISLNKLLENYSESKIDLDGGTSTRIYKYGFNGNITYNETSGLVEYIHFTGFVNVLY